MIRKAADCKKEYRENMRGGNGTVEITNFATPEELYFVVEYGKMENAAQLRLYLAEHGVVVCAEDAIGTLGAIA